MTPFLRMNDARRDQMEFAAVRLGIVEADKAATMRKPALCAALNDAHARGVRGITSAIIDTPAREPRT